MTIEITVSNPLQKQCEHCEKSFTAVRKDTKYCTRSCRQMAYIHRQAKLLNKEVFTEEIKQTQRKDGVIKRLVKFLW